MHPDDLVGRISSLASLPELCYTINEMVDNPWCDIAELEAVIRSDPALSGRILRMANSPLFGQVRKVETLSRALMLIGTNALRDIAIASSCVRSFANLSPSLVDLQRFWEHSLFVGIIAEMLAERNAKLGAERLFLMGLLHDIGHLVMYQTIPEPMAIIVEEAVQSQLPIETIERRMLGFDHGEVGAALIHDWCLPASLVTTTRCHHSPATALDWKLEAAVIHVANHLAKMAGKTGHKVALSAVVDEGLWRKVARDKAKITALLKQAHIRFDKTKSLFLAPLTHVA